MQVLMYGWEFPPKNQGGLGVACHGIVNALLEQGIGIKLVLPYHTSTVHSEDFEIIQGLNNAEFVHIPSTMQAYDTPDSYMHKNSKKDAVYGKDLFAEVEHYKLEAAKHAKDNSHDVIHAHDWMTYPAAIEAQKLSKKPLVLHIHATEIDRSGENPNPLVFEIEKLGFQHADKIIAVSELTKQKIIEHYNIDGAKIVVVHNAITKNYMKMQRLALSKQRKTVLFLGRMTMQKGPDYFLKAARKVLDLEPDVNFLMVGDGDMMGRVIHQSIELGIQENILFTGFLRGADVDRAFQNVDLFVMPSVSEPFGLVALEAIHNGTPVLMSKQAGVSEVIPNALKVDFWDIEKMANYIILALRHPELTKTLLKNSQHDLAKLSWSKQARKINNLYHSLAI